MKYYLLGKLNQSGQMTYLRTAGAKIPATPFSFQLIRHYSEGYDNLARFSDMTKAPSVKYPTNRPNV